MTIARLSTTVGLSDLVPALHEAAREYNWLMRTEGDMARRLKAIARVMSADQVGLDDQHVDVGDEDEQIDHRAIDDQLKAVDLQRPPRNAHLDAVLAAPVLEQTRAYVKAHRNVAARRVQFLAKQLAVYPWAEQIRGVGPLALGLIVAETGDLSKYANPAKVWKRMGLAVAPDGKAQRRISGRGDLSKGKTRDDATAEAIAMGYSPRRRSLMHVVGECLLKLNDGEYRALYDGRKAYEQATSPDLRLIQHHKRALRYIEKRFLKHLWQEWRRHAAPDRADDDQATFDTQIADVVVGDSSVATIDVLTSPSSVSQPIAAGVHSHLDAQREPDAGGCLTGGRFMAFGPATFVTLHGRGRAVPAPDEDER